MSKLPESDLFLSDGFILRPDARIVRNVWSSKFDGTSLTLGAHKKVVYIADIEDDRSMRFLFTESDALALECVSVGFISAVRYQNSQLIVF